jgi:hypothetical protein
MGTWWVYGGMVVTLAVWGICFGPDPLVYNLGFAIFTAGSVLCAIPGVTELPGALEG